LFLLAEKLPLFALAALSSWVTTTSATKFGVMQAQNLSFWVRIQNSLVSYVLYLRELLLPVDLSIHHERFLGAPSAGQLWFALAVLGGISVMAVRARRIHRYLVTGWLFYLVSFLPVIGLLQYAGHSIADRYAYVPSIGALIMVVWGLHAVLGRLRNARVLASAITFAVTLVFALLSLLQVGYWRSGEELFQHALDIAPNSPRLHNLFAVELMQRGALDEAAQHYTRAIELAPSYAKAYNNLGVLLLRRKRFSEAVEVYGRLLRIDPRNQWGHANLALALASQGHAAEAEKHYRLAIQSAPDHVAARTGLARLLASVGRIDEARAQLEVAVALYPTRSDLRALLAQLRKPAESATP
jgi:tetratricopeptide (TPR) repeat protein